MKLRRTMSFKKDYQKLPAEIQQHVDEKLRFLLNDMHYPSLRVHKLRGVEGVWEFSVTISYRVIFEIEADIYILLAVGPHRIVDRF